MSCGVAQLCPPPPKEWIQSGFCSILCGLALRIRTRTAVRASWDDTHLCF